MGSTQSLSNTRHGRLWVYAVLPPVIFNLVGCSIFGTYYGLASQQPELVADVDPGQLSFVLYVFVFVVEWAFAASIIVRLKGTGGSVMDLIAPRGDPWRFKWLPAVLLFAIFNAILAVYMTIVWAAGALQGFEGLSIWQRIFIIGLVPVQAGFCEELIWRGYIITELEARRRKRWPAILLSATSFALIHGIIDPLKLVATFTMGIVTGLYFTQHRSLVPLIVTHTIADVWSFGLFLFLS